MKLMGLVEWLIIMHQSPNGFLKRIKIRTHFHGDDMGLVWSCEEWD